MQPPPAPALLRATAGLIDRLIEHPKRAVVGLLVLTVAAGWWGGQIPINGDMEALLPADTPEVARAHAARDALGTRTALTVLIGGPERHTNRRVARTIAEALSTQTDAIKRVDFERETDALEANALLFLSVDALRDLEGEVRDVIAHAVASEMALEDLDDEERSRPPPPRFPSDNALFAEHGLEHLRPYRESPDGAVIAVTAYPRFKPQDIPRSRALMATVDAVIAEATAGEPVTSAVDGDYTGVSRSVNQLTEALKTATVLALLGVILVLWLAFRRLRAVVLVLAPLLAALAWTVAFARLAFNELNLISAFIFAILIGLGIDFAVHALARIDDAQRSGRRLPAAVKDALTQLSPPMRAAAGTTVATFASLLIFDFRGFSDFGGIAAVGVVMALVAVYLLVAPLSVILGGDARPPRETHGHSGVTAEGRRWAWSALCVMLMSTGWAAMALPELVFDGDMRAMRIAAPAEVDTLKRKYRAEVARRAPSPAVLLTKSLAETERVTRHLEAMVEREPRLEAVTSIASFVPQEQTEKRAIVAEIRRRVTQKMRALEGRDKADAERLLPFLNPTGLTALDLPEWLRSEFRDAQGDVGHFVLLFPAGVKSRAEEVLAIQGAIGALTIDGTTYHPTASWMFTGQAYKTVREEGPWAVGLAALLVLLLLLLDLRHLGAVMRAYLPLLAGVLLSLGIAARAGISLNLFNIVVLPVIFGIGIDTAIHLTHTRRAGASVRELLSTTGRAAGLSALTTAIGFGSLLAVPSEGLRSIGWLALIGIGCTTAFTTLGIAAWSYLEGTTEAPDGPIS
ncbi:MAG: MMPL family transporter [Myxococcota bacterium]